MNIGRSVPELVSGGGGGSGGGRGLRGGGWGGEVPAAGADLVALVIGGFDADFVVAAVEDGVAGGVGEGGLVAEFVAHILEGDIEIVDMVGEEGTATGLAGELLEDLVAIGLVIFAVVHLIGVGLREGNPLGAGADGVDDHAGALGHFDGFGAGVVGEIVVAIADENHDAADDVGLIAGRARGMAEVFFASGVRSEE